MPQFRCPSRDQLLAFSLGQLDEDSALHIGAHLDGCSQCCSLMETVSDANDTLAAALRRSVPSDEYERESGLKRATSLIQAIGREPSFVSREAAAASSPGEVADLGALGQYELLAKLGVGGMGTVYKALHTRLKRLVALKVLPEDRLRDQHSVDRFRREMEAVGKLDHPNIVRATDAGEVGDTHYLVMELVDGIDLSQLVRQVGPLQVAEACELIRQAAMGLEHAHQRGMVHRDIKPSNLMLARTDDGDARVKILDMGLALLATHTAVREQNLTSTGQMMGTLDYMAPEQGDDSHQVDIRADIYSLGATLFKLLCGETPFPAAKYNTPIKLLSALATTPAPSIASRRSDLSPGLVAVVDRMLAKYPGDRFATPAEVSEALSPFCQSADLPALLTTVHRDNDSPSVVYDPFCRLSQSDTAEFYKSSSQETESRRENPAALDRRLTQALTNAGASSAEESLTKSLPNAVVAGSSRSSGDTGWNRNERRVPAVAAALGGILLLGVITLYLQTNSGTLIVKIDDPQGLIRVSVVGEDVVVQDEQRLGEPITLRAGDHRLHVARGDLEFESNEFRLKRGETVVVHVKLADDRIEVVGNNKKLGQRSLPAVEGHAADRVANSGQIDFDRRAVEWVLSVGGSVGIEVAGNHVSIQDASQLPPEPFVVRQVGLSGLDVNEDGLAHLAPLRGLRILYTDARTNDLELAQISQIQSLNRLYFDIWSSPAPQPITRIGLEHISRLPNLETLGLPSAEFSEEDLQALQACTKLAELTLAGGQQYSDRSIEFIRSLSLHHLHVGWTNISDEALVILTQIPQLESLTASSTRITDEGLRHLASHSKLKHLALANTVISDAGLSHVARLPGLTSLILSGTRVTDAGLQMLGDSRKLARLDVSGTSVTDKGVEYLQVIPSLVHLTADRTRITDRSLQNLASHLELTQLDLVGTGVTDAGLEHLASLPKLTSLNLNLTKVTPAGVAKLQEQLPHCRITHSNLDRIFANAVFELGGTITISIEGVQQRVGDLDHLPATGVWSITGTHLDGTIVEEDQLLTLREKEISRLSDLCELTLAGSHAGPEFLNSITLNTNLERLNLTDTRNGVPLQLRHLPRLAELRLTNSKWLVAEGRDQLASFPALTTLAIGGAEVTDAALKYIQNVTQLKHLSLIHAPVRGPGLSYLRNLTNLERLDLDCPEMTDVGLKQLHSLGKLGRLSVAGTKVTAKGIAQLKLALPDCEIISDFATEEISAAMEMLKKN